MSQVNTPPAYGESAGPMIVAVHANMSLPFPAGPAEHDAGGSRVRSASSLLMRFSADCDGGRVSARGAQESKTGANDGCDRSSAPLTHVATSRHAPWVTQPHSDRVSRSAGLSGEEDSEHEAHFDARKLHILAPSCLLLRLRAPHTRPHPPLVSPAAAAASSALGGVVACVPPVVCAPPGQAAWGVGRCRQ